MKSLLSGIRILDLTRYFPGPFATLRLQERGAEVLKIEDLGGDPARFIGVTQGETSAVFRSMSRGKSCIALNLKDKQDVEKFYGLAKEADVVVESFRPGVAARLGIDFGTLARINPKLVYVSLSGYGQEGSMSGLGGHDLNYMAVSGLLDQLQDENGKPIAPHAALADMIASMATSEAILAGLVKKFKDGKGSYHDVSMTDAVLSFMGLQVTHWSDTGEEHGINDHGIGYGVYETADGRYISLCAMEPKFFVNFCKGVGREDLIAYHTTPGNKGNPHYMEVVNIIREKPLSFWNDFAMKVDCCMAPVMKTGELPDSVYVKERHMIETRWDAAYVATISPESGSFLNFDKPYEEVGESNKKFFMKEDKAEEKIS